MDGEPVLWRFIIIPLQHDKSELINVCAIKKIIFASKD